MKTKEINPNQVITRGDLMNILGVSYKTARKRYKEFVDLLEKPINKPYSKTLINKDLKELGFEMI